MYLLFVLLATIMWFTNAFSTRREITVTMPVSYTHIPDDYILSDAPVAKIRVTLEDEGVDLFANRNRHYELAFDLSNYIHGEEGSFVISMDEVRQVIVQQLAGDAALMSFTPETLSGTYTRQHAWNTLMDRSTVCTHGASCPTTFMSQWTYCPMISLWEVS